MEKLNFDNRGLSALGSALYHKRLDEAEWYRKMRKDEERKKPMGWPSTFSIEREKHLFQVVTQLDAALGCLDGIWPRSEANRISISSFAYDWWHLYDHQVLAVYLKPNLPGWNNFGFSLEETYDGLRPLMDWKNWDLALDALVQIFEAEFRYVFKGEERLQRSFKNHDETVFALLVSDLVNPPDPKLKGRKPGSSPNQHHWDALEPIYFALRQTGESKNGSAKQALAKLNLEIAPPSNAPKSAKVAYVAVDERSALNSIVAEMDKRELSRAL